jgi:glutathione synthase/RimK-type ligase-like ATP-grasp enzyme
MKVIILAQPYDTHTAAIKWALEQARYKVVCWGGISWKEAQQASLLLDQEPKIMLGPHVVEPGDCIWVRRPDLPVLNPRVSDADRKFAELEYRSFYNCIMYLLELLPVRVVNKFSASRFINNKAVQLRLARNCGLRIPKTLMSNAPQAINNFFVNNPNRAIFKTFTPHGWQRETLGGMALTETFELTHEQLPEDEILTYAPGIYQQMVVKQFDVRMVLMGKQVYSFALQTPRKALDWRGDTALGKVKVETIATPFEVERGMLAFAESSGISFGSADFAVDMYGQWWFLEINEEGQFLWLDQKNPDAHTQEKFCAFLTAAKDSTEPLEKRAGLFPSFAEYEKYPDKEPVEELAAAAQTSPFFSREP